MFKPKVVALLMGMGMLGMQSLAANAQVEDDARGAWPRQNVNRFLPSQLKYFEQQDRERAAAKRNVTDADSPASSLDDERGPWPRQNIGRFLPSQIRYFQEQERMATTRRASGAKDTMLAQEPAWPKQQSLD